MGLGINSKVFANTGVWATPEWEELNLISDMTVTGNWNEGDASTRRSPVMESEPTQMPLELSGKVRVEGNNTVYQLMRDRWLGRQIIDFMALNGPIDEDGVEGFRFEGKILNWSEDQALGNVLFKDFNIKPALSTNFPKFVIIEGGVPTYHDIGVPMTGS